MDKIRKRTTCITTLSYNSPFSFFPLSPYRKFTNLRGILCKQRFFYSTVENSTLSFCVLLFFSFIHTHIHPPIVQCVFFSSESVIIVNTSLSWGNRDCWNRMCFFFIQQNDTVLFLLF